MLKNNAFTANPLEAVTRHIGSVLSAEESAQAEAARQEATVTKQLEKVAAEMAQKGSRR